MRPNRKYLAISSYPLYDMVMAEDDPTRPKPPSISERLQSVKTATQEFRSKTEAMKTVLLDMEDLLPSPVTSDWAREMTSYSKITQLLNAGIEAHIQSITAQLSEIQKVDPTNQGMVKAARSFMLVHNDFQGLRNQYYALDSRIQLKLQGNKAN